MKAKVVREWLAQIGSKTLLIESDGPWENGCCESFNGDMRDELRNGESVYSLKTGTVINEMWRMHDN
ncbi:MAG: transposase [Azospirillum sp.]|nr:transposase [Azospirillum sp.]